MDEWVNERTCSLHMTIRRTASPTAEIETMVPMQYLMTSYFAASSWAFSE
uniref:Uncharacterized protein n=1 Tax=Arundo donax TaxID=35708 RepID=A0A0A9F5X8_ARUDO